MSGILDNISGLGDSLLGKGQSVIDSIFPPEKRAELIAKLKSFAVKNPKLSAFLLANFALTGFPLFMFVVFTITVFVFSLIVALLVGVLAALLFTVFMVGVALIVVLPTVFMTTMAATFVFLWGLGGYYIMKWFNKGGQAPEGQAIGDKLNSLTGGRIGFLMDGARKQEGKGESQGLMNGDAKKENGDVKKEPAKQEHATPEKRSANGVPSQKHVENMAKNADVGNVTDKVGKTANVGGVKNKAAGTVGTVKGTLGGATGLT